MIFPVGWGHFGMAIDDGRLALSQSTSLPRWMNPSDEPLLRLENSPGKPLEKGRPRAPIPKFASYCGDSDANFGIKGALAIFLF
jgi:hypothetical protein